MEQLQILAFFLVKAAFVLYAWIHLWFEITKPETPSVVSTASECELETAEGKDSPFDLVLLVNPESPSTSNANITQMDEDTEDSRVDNFQTISVEDFKSLEADHKFYWKEIKKYRRKFKKLSIIVTGFEDIQKENQKLTQEIASLQESALKNDSDRQATERHLRQENNNLQEKLDRLEKENRMITDRTQKRQSTTSISHQNDKRAASLREIATKWESNCLSESLLIEENVALKKNLDIWKSASQMKTVELSRVVEENRMLNSKLELSFETLTDKLEVLDQLKGEFYELKDKYQATALQNDNLRKELTASREITVTKCEHFQRISQAHESAVQSAQLSTKYANELAQAREAANEILQSTVADLKTKLSTCQYENDELKKDETCFREIVWNSEKTISQLGEQIESLKEELKSQEQSFSSKMLELERVKDEFLKSSLDSVKESLASQLAEKSTHDEQIRTHLLDLKHYEFEKEKTELRQHIEFLEKENQQMWKTRESAVTSAEKAEKMALEQVAALSESLNILQAAATHAKDARAATEGAEDVLGITDEADTDSKPSDTGKGNKFKNWFMKHGVTTQKPVQENEKIKLMRSTGVSMMEKAKLLKEQAKNLKVKGKSLKKKAKKHLRK